MVFLLPKTFLCASIFVFFSLIRTGIYTSGEFLSDSQMDKQASKILTLFILLGLSKTCVLEISVKQLYLYLNYNWQQKYSQTHSINVCRV